MNYYNTDTRLVTPVTAQGHTYQISPAQATLLLQSSSDGPAMAHNSPQANSTIDNVFTPMPIGKDPYSPVQRALGMVVRLLVLALVYLILAYGIVTQAALSEPWFYLCFGIPMAITVAYMSRQTDRHTPAGVELERIAAAERTEFTKGERQERILAAHLANQQELRRMALEATLRMIEKGANDGKQ